MLLVNYCSMVQSLNSSYNVIAQQMVWNADKRHTHNGIVIPKAEPSTSVPVSSDRKTVDKKLLLIIKCR